MFLQFLISSSKPGLGKMIKFTVLPPPLLRTLVVNHLFIHLFIKHIDFSIMALKLCLKLGIQ